MAKPQTRDQIGHQRRSLLGRERGRSRDHPKPQDRGRRCQGDAEAGGKPKRSLSEVVRESPRGTPRSSSLPWRLSQGLKGWAGALPKDLQGATIYEGGLDGKLEGGRWRRTRRIGKVEEETRGDEGRGGRPASGKERKEEEKREEGRRRDKSYGNFRRKRKKEKEKEKEEEKGPEGKGGQRAISGLWVHGTRPGRINEKESEAEGEEASEEEREERGRRGGQLRERERKFQRQLRGRGLQAFRGGNPREESLEPVPRSFDLSLPGADAITPGVANRATLADRQGSAASSVLAILEDDASAPDGRTHGSRKPDPVLHPGLVAPGPCSRGVRCDHAEAERTRASFHGGSLQHSPETRVSPCRSPTDGDPYGDLGSQQVAARRGEGESSVQPNLGQATGEREEAGRSERQGSREEQRKWKERRLEERCRHGQRRQGKEVRKKLGESGYSVEGLRERAGSVGSQSGTGNSFTSWTRDDVPAQHAKGFLDPAVEPSSTEHGSAGFSEVSPVQKTFSEMVDCFSDFFNVLLDDLFPSHSKVQSSGIFPLPEAFTVVSEAVRFLADSDVKTLVLICKALNSYHGVRDPGRIRLSQSCVAALKALSAYAVDFGAMKEKFEGVSWDEYLRVKSIDYKGDEVKLARSFCWRNIEPALPPGIGSIPLDEICELGTLDYILNFEKYLLPDESRVLTKAPRIFVDDGEWEQVCAGLLDKGVCQLLAKSDVYELNGCCLFSGMFGVSKEEFSQDGVEIMRLIMNLVPVNRLCRNLGGDISTLPSWAGMTPYLLEENQVILMSSEDIRCFFYLFEIPMNWRRFMAFGKEVPVSLCPPGSSEAHFLASRVLPMGFLNSVSIAQHVHRRIARMSLHGIKPSLGPQNEIRKDKPFAAVEWHYRVYLDNFDTLSKVDKELAEQLTGQVSTEVLAMRQGYQYWGLPRHPKKSVEQQPVAEVQGAIVDGVTGRVKPKPQKILKYIELAWSLVQVGRSSQKQMQIVCGGLVYCCMFRRPLLGLLNQVWNFISSFAGEPPVIKKDLPPMVKFELIRFIAAVPLAQMNLRTPVCGSVTASDASEYGGGFCVTSGLTPMGVHAAGCAIRGDLPDVEDHVQVLSIGLFDGIGALRVACDILRLPMAGHISSEVSKEGSRVLESHFPDTVSVGDVQLITQEHVLEWGARYSNVGVVLVGGGPPCQGVSGLNSDRKGALKDARSKLFTHVRRIYDMCVQVFVWAQVHFLMESVFSMDAKDRGIMSQHMRTTPFMVDASNISICRRPRLYWVSWEVQATAEAHVSDSKGEGWEDYQVISLEAQVEASNYLLPGWELVTPPALPTFTTSRPRAHPGNRPAGLWQCSDNEILKWKADDHRYPPYVYRDCNGVRDGQGVIRLPSIREKEVAMGFSVDYTAPCLPKGKQHGSAYEDVRHTLIGNSWSVPVVSWLLSQLFAPLGLTDVRSPQQVVQAVRPGGSPHLQTYLQRPPLGQCRKTIPEVPEASLTKKLLNFVSIKGEDLLLQASSENTVRFHRLRSSVPARLWRWKVVCGWEWRRSGFHINVLEMQSVLTCLQWRLNRRRDINCRLLHLTDSLVTLHALSRGRSSSRKFRAVLSKINSLLLASDVHPLWGYVSTKQNPADRPSRRRVFKVWGKRKHI